MDHATAAQLKEEVLEIGKLSKKIAADTVGLLGGNAKGWEVSLEAKIRERPVQSLLIAAGIGVALGFLWKRR